MKKPLLFVAIIVSIWSCNKDPEFPTSAPSGIYEELIWVPVLTSDGYTRLEQREFDELSDIQKDTLMYVCSQVNFIPTGENSGRMEVIVRYGDGEAKPNVDSTRCYSGPRRTDYFTATYTIEEGFDSDRTPAKYIAAQCTFTGPDFSSVPLPCASGSLEGTREFTRHYDYTYEEEESTALLRTGYTDQGRKTIQLFRQK